jgi:hypothetical protein
MTTIHLDQLLELTTPGQSFDEWMIIGVFPTKEDVERDGGVFDWNWFCYTNGLGVVELWAPCKSIEGWSAGNELVGMFLNYIALGWSKGIINPGDDVIIPIGIPDHPDADSVWWIGQPEPARRRGVNITDADTAVPILWSSPMGFPGPDEQ